MPALLFKVACVQTTAGPDPARNARLTFDLIAQAARTGAKFVCLPEAVDVLDEDPARLRAQAVPMATHASLTQFRRAAQTLGVWVLVGSITALNEHGETVNRCVLLDDQGAIRGHYDKIHLFDAMPGTTRFTESDLYVAGRQTVVVGTPWMRLGLSICYDLRFPHLFRALAHAGAMMLTVPSAFMKNTGQAHWHALLRARAIENGCFVIAPAQCGNPYGTRWSYGHSLIVDPWGTVLAEAGEEPGVIVAECDPDAVARARSSIPSLSQDRSFDLP